MRRPSPKRSAFSSCPIAGIADRVPLVYRAVASTSQRSPSSLRARTTYSAHCASPIRSRAGARPRTGLPSTSRVRPWRVTASSASSPVSPGYLGDLDPRRADGPGRRRPAHRLGTVGRREHRVDGVGERRDAVVRLVLLDQQRSVGERDEVHGVAREQRRFGGRDRVPAPRARHTVDARLAPRLTVPARRLGRLRGCLVRRWRDAQRGRLPRPAFGGGRCRRSRLKSGDVAVVGGMAARLDDAALAVALHLALELDDELVDRHLHVGRGFPRSQRRAFREDRSLGHVAVGDRRVLAARRARPRPASVRPAACSASPAFARRTRAATGRPPRSCPSPEASLPPPWWWSVPSFEPTGRPARR